MDKPNVPTSPYQCYWRFYFIAPTQLWQLSSPRFSISTPLKVKVVLYGGLPYTLAMGVEKRERLEARIPTSLKADLLRAAALQSKSLTDYLVEHLGNAARATIESHSNWQLSQADSEAFAEALMNPAPPNPKLQRAFKRFAQHQQNS